MFASKLDKTSGFIGCDALKVRIAEGSNRKILQFLLEQNQHFIYHNEPIYLNDQLVGSITTGTYGHTFDAPIGLGWVTIPAEISDEKLEEQQWEILVAGNRIKARASVKPVYDPQNRNLRS
jgi:4-methylaminobutanoate oxidase (formaldehyde-forming)